MTPFSPHQVGVADLILGARLLGELPQELVLIRVVPERIELNYGLSPSVAAAIPELAGAVVAQARAFGFDFAPAQGEA
jgi:hydrogenase maturation protease